MQQLVAAPRAPERAIAVVLDASRNLSPQCFEDWNTVNRVFSSAAPQGLFAGFTRTLCDETPRWRLQRDGLIQALRTSVPLDGSVAVSVVVDALHQEGQAYQGPRIVIPYTVLRTEAVRNEIIHQLSVLDLSLDQPTTDYTFSWPGSTCRGSYDSSNELCYSPAAHAWAAHIAREELTRACPNEPGASGDAAVGDAAASDASADSACLRPKYTEICLVGDARHTGIPSAFWDRGTHCFSSTAGGAPECDLTWPDNVPEEAKQHVPFESIASVDRFTVVQHDIGLSPAMFAASVPGTSATPNPLYETEYGQPAWGAAISVDALAVDEPPAVGGLFRVDLAVVRYPGSTAPRQVVSLSVNLDAGDTAETAAGKIYQLLLARLTANSASLPVRPFLLGRRVLLDWNPSFDFNLNNVTVLSLPFLNSVSVSGDDGYFPSVAVTNTHPALRVTLSGGAVTPHERAVQHQQVVVARNYGEAMLGKGPIVFASGFLPNQVAEVDGARAVDFGRAIARCFDPCDNGDVIQDEARAAPGQPAQQHASFAPSAAPGGTSTASATSPAAQSCAPISLVAAEVTQVIQTWNNDIPLIKNKPTAVRVHVESPTPGQRGFKVRVRGFSYKNGTSPCDPSSGGSACTRFEFTDAPSASPDVQVPVSATAVRDDLTASATFLLPTAWSAVDVLELLVEGVGSNKLDCKERADGTPKNDCYVRVKFTQHQRPTLVSGTPLASGDGRRIQLQPVNLVWAQNDPNGDLDVKGDEVALAVTAIRNMVPLDLEVLDLRGMVVTPSASTWVKGGGIVPDIAWYRRECPNCSPSQPNIEAAWWSSRPDVAQQLYEFQANVLQTELEQLRHRTFVPSPQDKNQVFHGMYHLPPQQIIGGEGIPGAGQFLEDMGATFQSGASSGPHEFLHAVGRPHTDYCMTGYEAQRPQCDEPYPYELERSGAAVTSPGQVLYGNSPHPPNDRRPAIGPLDVTGNAWQEVWGYELGAHHARKDYLPFPRPTQSNPSDFELVAPRAYSPRTTFDLMSYCDTLDTPTWMSKYQHDRLLGAVTTLDGVRIGEHLPRFSEYPQADTLALSPPPPSPWCVSGFEVDERTVQQNRCVAVGTGSCGLRALLVRGLWNRATNWLGWDPALRIDERAESSSSEVKGIPAELSLRAAGGTELYRVTTALAQGHNQAAAGASPWFRFSATVPIDGVHEIALISDNTELGRLQASASMPHVVIDANLTGSSVNSDVVTFRWTGEDADGDTLYYTVDYSADDGASYLPLSTPSTRQELTYDTRYLPGTTTARLRVTVSDGFHSTAAVSGRFSVALKPPRPAIVSLYDGVRFSGAETIVLDALALDQEQGEIPDAALVWTSNRAGSLGTGRRVISALELAEGFHDITVTATDRDGLVGTATKRIEIRRFDTAPFVGPRLLLDCTHDGDFEVNQPGAYLLRATNVGAGDATGTLTITDTLPQELSYAGATGDGWSCSADGSRVTCTHPNTSLAPGAAAPPLALQVRPLHLGQDPATVPYYDVTNYAAATIENGGANSAARASDATRVRIPLAPAVDISTSNPGSVVVGKPLVYKLDVRNTGAGPAYELTVAFSVPVGATVQSASGADWSCTLAARSGKCVSGIEPVAPGVTLPELAVVVTVEDRNLTNVQLSYTVSAKGSANATDAGVDGGDRVTSTSGGSTTQTRVQDEHAPGADLSIRVTEPCEEAPYWVFCTPAHYVYPDIDRTAAFELVRGDAARVRGGTWSHTVFVKNVGTEPAFDVRFSWLLPPDARWYPRGQDLGSGHNYAGWRCNQVEQAVQCVYDESPLEVGEEVGIELLYGISKTAAPYFVHVFQTSTDDGDADLRNNTAQRETILYAVAQPCLMLDDGNRCIAPASSVSATTLTTLISITDPLVVGENGQATFTVRNVGGVPIRKSTIGLRALGDPSLLAVDGASGAGWSCGLSWGRATCLYLDPSNGDLLAGDSLPPVTVTFRVGPHLDPVMRIPAEVSATGLQTYRASITAAVRQTAAVQGPTTGTLAYTACPPGYDCNQYLPRYPTNYTQGYRQMRLLDLSTLRSSLLLPESQRLFFEEPAWSRDGVRLAVLQRFGLCTPEPDADCQSGLFILHLTTRFMSIYWGGAGTREFIAGSSSTAGGASWAPNGTHLLFPGASFVRPTATCAPQYFGDSNDDCFKLRVTTPGSRTLFGRSYPGGAGSLDSLVLDEPGGGVLHPDWSPTGNVVAYISGSPAKIWLVNVTATGTTPTNKRRLTTAPSTVHEERPAFSPNGMQIAYSSNGELHVIRADGTGDYVLTSGQADTHPTWSPDGTQIAFERGGNDPGIFVVAVSGGQPVLVARGMHPAWRPSSNIPAVVAGVQPPVVGADHLSTEYATAVTGNIVANDSDPAGGALSLVSFEQGARGSVNCTADGSCSYTPKSGFVGQDAFAYTVQNVGGARSSGTVRVDVSGASPQIIIESPGDNAPVGASNSVSLSGVAKLDYHDPAINVLYVVDEHNSTGTPGTAEPSGGTIPGSGLPFAWVSPSDGHSTLCGDSTGAPDSTLIDCYLTKLNRSLLGTPSVNVGVIMFADDSLGPKPNADLWLMQSPQHSPIDYRPNVFSLDLASTSGHDAWIGPGTDNDKNGRPDVEDVLASINHFAPGTISCGFPPYAFGTNSTFTAGGRVFGPPLGRPTPAGDPRQYSRDIMCRLGGFPTTYDWVLDSINKSLATRPASEHNVAYLVSAGRMVVSDDPESPLQEAIRAGTTIHTFAPKPGVQPDPVDVVWFVNTSQSSSAERAHIAARMARFASQMIASGLDYRVTLASSSDWFAGTGLAYDYRATGADSTEIAVTTKSEFGLPVRPNATLHIIGVNISNASQRFGHFVFDGMDIRGGTLIGTVTRSYFGHMVATLGPEWCPGTPIDGWSAFSWAGRGVKLLTCANDWDALYDAIVRTPSSGLAYAVAGHRYLGSCEPNNPLARIAQRTGGTCTELDWNASDVVAKLPAAPRLGLAAGTAIAENIARIELSRPGQAATLATLTGSEGRWTGQLNDLLPGVNIITAKLFTTRGQVATAAVTVVAQTGYNRAPLIQEQYVRAVIGEPLAIDLLRNASDPDGDVLSVSLASTHPSLTCSSAGLCTYLAPADATEDLTVAFEASDGRGGITPAQLHISHNQPPSAGAHAVRVKQSAAVSLDVLAGASDPDGDALELVDWTASQHGSVGCSAPSTCTYVASATFSGIDSFEYTVVDAYGATATNRVSVLVERRGVDVGLSLSHVGGDMVVGLERAVEAVVYNLGETTLSAATVRLDLPALTYTRVDPVSGWSCTASSQAQCQRSATVQPGQAFPTLRVFVRPTDLAVPQVYMRAFVVVPGDQDATNDSAEALVPVHQPRLDAAVELTAATTNLCTQNTTNYVARVTNPGGSALTQGLQLTASLPPELRLVSVSGSSWQCTFGSSGFTCTYPLSLAAGAAPTIVNFSLARSTPLFGVRTVALQVTAPGDTSAANDTASVALTLLDSQLDTDGDGRVDCADNCPDLSNSAQTDTDLDGRGNVCDNCPQTANATQLDTNLDGAGDACQPTVDIRWVSSNGLVLQSDVQVKDPNNDPVQGDVVLYGPPIRPTSIRLDVLSGCGTGMARIRLNGQLIATPSWSSTICVCSSFTPKTLIFDDPALLGAYDLSGGPNVLSMEMAGGGARQLAWVRALVSYEDNDFEELCVFDARPGGSCILNNACTNGATDAGISVARTLTPKLGATTRVLEHYTASTPGRVWDLDLPEGVYTLVVTGTDGKTPPVSDSQVFTFRGESILDINPMIDVAPRLYPEDWMEVCSEIQYRASVYSVGTKLTTATTRLRGTFPTGITPVSVGPTSEWSCSFNATSFDCATNQSVERREELSVIPIRAQVVAPVGSLLTFTATSSTTGDGNATNDTVSSSGEVRPSSNPNIDPDNDGVPSCLDVCPNNVDVDADGDKRCDIGTVNADNCVGVSNPTQADGDGDGIGDACDLCKTRPGGRVDSDGDGVGDDCDNCPATSNANQADRNADGSGDACQPVAEIHSITPGGSALAGDIEVSDPNGDPLHGVVRVVRSVPPLDAIAIDVVGVCDPARATVKMNGHVIASYVTTSRNCFCQVESTHTQTLPRSQFEQWYDPEANNVLELDLTRDSGREQTSIFTWVKVATLHADGSVDEQCVFDASGTPNCPEPPLNLCGYAYFEGDVHVEHVLPPTTAVFASASYSASRLPNRLDVTGVPAGSYELQVTADDGNTRPADARQIFALQGQTTILFGCADEDGDGLCEGADNCAHAANPNQIDSDSDGRGDACDPCAHDATDDAADRDGVCQDVDNCPLLANPAQADTDRDGRGDVCDVCPYSVSDDASDADGVCDDVDNCIGTANADQRDTDGDARGDVCDFCPTDATNDTSDGDGVCDDVDNCLGTANLGQLDFDRDGAGDACDVCPRDSSNDASDNDGVCNDVDNCPLAINPDQIDADHDGAGDACDACRHDPTNDASDRDGVCDDVDNCVGVANPSQTDTDRDGKGDSCDACPSDATNDASDRDGICTDRDNCPAVPNPDQADVDGDGHGNACDACPLDRNDDVDRDGLCGNVDNCPTISNPSQADADRDGIGDACDTSSPDEDRDGVPNSKDRCPNTPANTPVNPADGCSVDQLCPCRGPGNQCGGRWRNHGEYVSCVTHAAQDLVKAKVITGAQKGAIVSKAATSSCGK